MCKTDHGEKKREPMEDTWCMGRGSRWQAHWSAGCAGTEVPVVMVLGQGSFQTAQQSWEWGGGWLEWRSQIIQEGDTEQKRSRQKPDKHLLKLHTEEESHRRKVYTGGGRPGRSVSLKEGRPAV